MSFDSENNILTTPAYMKNNATPFQVYLAIEKLVQQAFNPKKIVEKGLKPNKLVEKALKSNKH